MDSAQRASHGQPSSRASTRSVSKFPEIYPLELRSSVCGRAGAAFMALRLLMRLPRDRKSQRATGSRNAMPFGRGLLTRGVPVILSAAGQGPSVEGVLRPQITLPPGIDGLLTERELDAVLIHE